MLACFFPVLTGWARASRAVFGAVSSGRGGKLPDRTPTYPAVPRLARPCPATFHRDAPRPDRPCHACHAATRLASPHHASTRRVRTSLDSPRLACPALNNRTMPRQAKPAMPRPDAPCLAVPRLPCPDKPYRAIPCLAVPHHASPAKPRRAMFRPALPCPAWPCLISQPAYFSLGGFITLRSRCILPVACSLSF